MVWCWVSLTTGIYRPTQNNLLKRGLTRFAGKHNKWPITRVSEEENVFTEHAAYQERSVLSSGLCPAEEGLKQLSECRNKAKREYYMC